MPAKVYKTFAGRGEPPERLELSTSRLRSVCSTIELGWRLWGIIAVLHAPRKIGILILEARGAAQFSGENA